MAPIKQHMKSGPFKRTRVASKALEEIKSKMITAPVLCLLDFDKVIEVACDTSHVGIGVVLSQEGPYFSEKLNVGKALHHREIAAIEGFKSMKAALDP
ncbi:hypothetical protein RJ640_010116 [Escallonia rubra]|uniref:Reverse transcriptase/retrotransposon-derived protein RNase H-like domain-containing protein n=1 Tax=Escallonia rubra TaxID=112253 RepID=A0AA88RPP8_9ASTE|nr:hypothetical protein RJ640_010116 [Escallonia rubra]